MTKVRVNREHVYLLALGKVPNNRLDFFKNQKAYDIDVELEDDELQGLIQHHEEQAKLGNDLEYHNGWVDYFTRATLGLA